jgi:hypothetical protein
MEKQSRPITLNLVAKAYIVAKDVGTWSPGRGSVAAKLGARQNLGRIGNRTFLTRFLSITINRS